MQPKQFFQKQLLFYSLVYVLAFAPATGCVKDIQSAPDETETSIVSSAAETTPPTVNFTSPIAGSTVLGTITVSVNATDNTGVASVLVKVDGVKLGKKTAAPYDFTWNTTFVLNGTHLLLAKAVDVFGNSKTKKITVTTENPGILPPEQDLINLINNERAIRELPPLTLNSKLQAAARIHSNDMAKNNIFSHIGSAGDTLADRLNAQGYAWTGAGENIAGGQTTAQAVFDAMMANTQQKSLIVDPTMKDIGVGGGYSSSVTSSYHWYWTVVIAK